MIASGGGKCGHHRGLGHLGGDSDRPRRSTDVAEGCCAGLRSRRGHYLDSASHRHRAAVRPCRQAAWIVRNLPTSKHRFYVNWRHDVRQPTQERAGAVDRSGHRAARAWWRGSTGWPPSASGCRCPGRRPDCCRTIEDQGEARISDLAALDHCSQPTMTTQVRRLEDAGLVTRTIDPDDARAVLIRITAARRRTIAGAGPRRPRRRHRSAARRTRPPKTARCFAPPSECCTACSKTLERNRRQ